MENEYNILIKDNEDDTYIYGFLKVKGNYNLQEIQNFADDLRDEVGYEDYFVDILVEKLNEHFKDLSFEYLGITDEIEI